MIQERGECVMKKIEKYSVLEMKFENVSCMELFVECGELIQGNKKIKLTAFKNQAGEYIVRCMPTELGVWSDHVQG